ncbi:MAG TPA: hydrogenase, partial [Alphaproteobacteria bacterium]|nr:hydrogenase [Alphaproteobacteria bacterium]
MVVRQIINGLIRDPVTERPPPRHDEALAEVAAALDRAARRRLGRSLS